MESNAMTWNEVATSIIDDDRGKWDRKLPAAQLWIGQNGQLVTMNGGPAPEPYVLSELATGQLCERLGIPAPYYRRLPPEMKATVANFDLQRMSEQSANRHHNRHQRFDAAGGRTGPRARS